MRGISEEVISLKEDKKEYRVYRERKRYARINCPYCDVRHYWTRTDKWKLRKEGGAQIICPKCGGSYWILLNADGVGTHIRAKRREG